MEITTLDKIKKISLRLFNERGYDGTSLKDIFNEIGISAPSFYYYYASKKDLYVELIKNTYEYNQQYVTDLLGKSRDKSARGKIYELSKAIVRFVLEHKEESNFIFRNSVFPNYEFKEDTENFTREWRKFYWDKLMLYIEEGQKNGEITKNSKAEVIGHSYFNLVMGVGYNPKVFSSMKKADEIAPYFEIFYKGIAA